MLNYLSKSTINLECYIILKCITHLSCVHISWTGCGRPLSHLRYDESNDIWQLDLRERVLEPQCESSYCQQGHVHQEERMRPCCLLCSYNASCERSRWISLNVKVRTWTPVRKRSCEKSLRHPLVFFTLLKWRYLNTSPCFALWCQCAV